MLHKEVLREHYKQKRKALTEETIQQLSREITKNISKIDIFNHKYFHVFLTMNQQKEIDTKYIINFLREQKKTIITSQTLFKQNELKHFILEKNTPIEVNKWGIPEPMQAQKVSPELAQVVFVPLLACDIWGNRIGYGKGFYDRFLQQCKPNTVKIGLTFFPPENKQIENNIFDIPLDFIVTPSRIYRVIQ